MQGKPLVGISSCLLGENVRYDGVLKLNPYLKQEMSTRVEFLAVCPETESGMPVPREPMDLFEIDGRIRMITLGSETDMTGSVEEWIEKKLYELSELKLCGFVFKARSPSCAVTSAMLHTESGSERNGEGLFAKAITERFPLLPVAEEEKLQNTVQREEFLERVFRVHKLQSR